MPVKRAPPRIDRVAPRADIVDVLDRVLDKGIVVDAWLGISVLGIRVVEVDARAVVSSISTRVKRSDAVREVGMAVKQPAVCLEPVRGSAARGRRGRRPSTRRHGSPWRCHRGCTFFGSPERPVPVGRLVIACPYRERIVCVLTPV